MATIYIGADNSVILDGLQDSTDSSYINTGATLTFTVYRQRSQDAAMTAASTTLTSQVAAFVAGDVGKSVVVAGAGVDGADLRATISSVTSATQVVLSTAASTTVAGTQLLTSLAGAAVISMSYVASSNGKYRGTIVDTVAFHPGQTYWIEISIDGGSSRTDFRRISAVAQYRNLT